jgi:hypothetical protein
MFINKECIAPNRFVALFPLALHLKGLKLHTQNTFFCVACWNNKVKLLPKTLFVTVYGELWVFLCVHLISIDKFVTAFFMA